MSLEELGQGLGLSKVSVWCWEADRSSPRKDRLGPLAEALGVCVRWLLYGDEADGQARAISDSRIRIAEAYGVDPEHVEIRVVFGDLDSNSG